MTFKAGESGNISGRPRDSQQMKNARELFRMYTEEAALFIGKVVKNAGEDTKLRLQAANVILDRAFGKPATDTGGSDSGSQQQQFDASLLIKLLDDFRKQRDEMIALEAELKLLKQGKSNDS